MPDTVAATIPLVEPALTAERWIGYGRAAPVAATGGGVAATVRRKTVAARATCVRTVADLRTVPTDTGNGSPMSRRDAGPPW
ncbi:hypothetical protein SaccyDRAFT_3497 [Saccharomonospora cyanea NA-134]|uniref:Uncharacterized protein n=1 Tax=Saccharomonospora cyanea NA-134 TaxID=882082 RepID=H5XCT2_9PSEU|nr:hypothetical protein SaccyDRAFT_3497 [Saccharomonospora cyanea NA-134]